MVILKFFGSECTPFTEKVSNGSFVDKVDLKNEHF